MKGLARLELVVCKLAEGSKEARREATDMAKSLLKDYPQSAIASRADQLIKHTKSLDK
jgi:hypothetical protein